MTSVCGASTNAPSSFWYGIAVAAPPAPPSSPSGSSAACPSSLRKRSRSALSWLWAVRGRRFVARGTAPPRDPLFRPEGSAVRSPLRPEGEAGPPRAATAPGPRAAALLGGPAAPPPAAGTTTIPLRFASCLASFRWPSSSAVAPLHRRETAPPPPPN